MAEKNKTPKMARPGLGEQEDRKKTNRETGAEENRNKKIKKKENKTLGEKQFQTYKSELDTQFDKGQRIQKTYEGASPKIKEDLKKRFKGVFNPKEMVASSRRDAAKTFAKGGSAKKKKRGAAIKGVSKILR